MARQGAHIDAGVRRAKLGGHVSALPNNSMQRPALRAAADAER
jgi:hypothetical protein